MKYYISLLSAYAIFATVFVCYLIVKMQTQIDHNTDLINAQAKLERDVSQLYTQNKDLSDILNKLGETNVSLKDEITKLREKRLKTLVVTAYTASKDECDSNPSKTAIMTAPKSGQTVAVSHDLKNWLGQWVYITNFGIRRVEDLMNERYTARLDILVPSKSHAKKIGLQNLDVVLIGPTLSKEDILKYSENPA